jgi:hypothetical protein
MTKFCRDICLLCESCRAAEDDLLGFFTMSDEKHHLDFGEMEECYDDYDYEDYYDEDY